MMHGMMNGKVNEWTDVRMPSALGSSSEILDGAMTLVDKIRVLEDRRMAAFRLSSVGRRRLLFRIHAAAVALAAEPARKAPSRRR